MDPSQATKPISEAAATRTGLVLGKRRKFLVSKRDQLKSTLMSGSVVFLLLIFINAMLYQSSQNSTAQILADAPELAPIIHAQDRAERLLIGLASLVFLGGVMIVGIIETHRTAGAAINIRRQLGQIGKGHYATRVKLRKGDNLRDLEKAFNAMAVALEHNLTGDLETLHRLADEAEKGADGARIASELRKIVSKNSKRLRPDPGPAHPPR